MLRDYSIEKCCFTSDSTGQLSEGIWTNLRFSKKQSQRGISLSSTTNLLLAGQRPRMDELAGCEVLEFLRSGLPPQDFVAVRMPAETGDNVTMTTGLVRGELEYAAMLLWCLFDKFRCEIDRSLQIRENLGMAEGQEKESFLPGIIQGCIMTVSRSLREQG